MQCSMRAVIDCNRAIMESDFRTELASITVPTLVVHGDADVSAPIGLTGKPTAQLVPRSRFKLHEGAPHGLLITHADQINADIIDFIDGA